MLQSIDIWKLLAGISFFLMGIESMERSIKHLGSRSFKLFLKKHTSSKFKAVLSGTLISALLQSSSVVNIFIITLAGTSVIKLPNALALILGSNLGSTASSWMLAFLGFSYNIEQIAFPLIGILGIIISLTKYEDNVHQWSKLIVGFGLLFLGLHFITSGMETYVHSLNFDYWNSYPAVYFLLFGLFITAIVQSSSVTVAIILSALHVNAINLFSASVLVLGAEIGTSFKLILASLSGQISKKRVAIGNLIFNLIAVIPTFVFLKSIIHFIERILGIKNVIYSLALFQSLVNIIGIVIVFPFLEYLSKLIEKKISFKHFSTGFIQSVPSSKVDLALIALEKELRNVFIYSIEFANRLLEIKSNKSLVNSGNKKHFVFQDDLKKAYEKLKHLHGTCHDYSIKIQQASSNKKANERLDALISANRNLLYAVKSIKDALTDIKQLKNSSNDTKFLFFQDMSALTNKYTQKWFSLLEYKMTTDCFNELKFINNEIIKSYGVSLKKLYQQDFYSSLSEVELSTLFNFNHEMYVAFKSFNYAAKDLFLHAEEAATFDELPGFIR